MAKNCFLLVLLFTASTAASFAQVKIGLMGGPQSASITEKNNIAGWDSTTGKYYTSKSGIHVGIMAEIPLAPLVLIFIFSLQPVCTQKKEENFAKNLDTMTLQSDSLFYSYNTTTNLTINVNTSIFH